MNNFSHLPLLGQGADGKTYQLSDKVLKVFQPNKYQLNELEPVLNYLYHHNSPIYCSIYSYGPLSKGYYYLTEKLNPLTEDEYKVFHTVVSHEDRNLVKNYPLAKVKKILGELAWGLDFPAQMIIFFCEALQSSPIKHLDLHPRNILKDNSGNFKLIDLNRTKLEIKIK